MRGVRRERQHLRWLRRRALQRAGGGQLRRVRRLRLALQGPVQPDTVLRLRRRQPAPGVERALAAPGTALPRRVQRQDVPARLDRGQARRAGLLLCGGDGPAPGHAHVFRGGAVRLHRAALLRLERGRGGPDRLRPAPCLGDLLSARILPFLPGVVRHAVPALHQHPAADHQRCANLDKARRHIHNPAHVLASGHELSAPRYDIDDPIERREAQRDRTRDSRAVGR